MRMRAGLCLASVVSLVLLAGAAWAQTAEVAALDNSYEPRRIEVAPGTTVNWTNEGDAPHTVTADDGSFDSGNMDSGDEFSETFAEPGRYPYFCEYHGAPGQGMAGVVVVTGAEDDGNGGDDDNDDVDDPTEDGAPAGDDTPGGTTETADDGDLPATGTAVDAFIYLALALIGAGMVLMKLGSPPALHRR